MCIAPTNTPFYEWVAIHGLNLFEGNYDEFDLNLETQTLQMMLDLRQQYSEILLMPSDFRVDVMKALRKLNNNDSSTFA